MVDESVVWIMSRTFMEQRAESLIDSSRTIAASCFVPLLDKYSFLREANIEQWDFILTVAGIFIATTRLSNLSIDDDSEDALITIVSRRLKLWSPEGIAAFENCKEVFEKQYEQLIAANYENEYVASDALGLWIVLNVLGRMPDCHEEIEFQRSVGVLVVSAFFDWWDDK